MYSRREVEEQTILLSLVGSRAYNLHTPDSDSDYKGVMCQTTKQYLGYSNFEQKDKGFTTEEPYLFPMLEKDTVIYDIKKFISLASKCNPNILELLYMDEYVHITPAGQNLIKHRRKFINESIKRTYVGYAYSQIKRMENHRYWLLNPEQVKPKPEDFGFSEDYKILSKQDVFSFLEFLYSCIKNKIEYLEPTEEFRSLLYDQFDIKAVFKNYPLQDESINKIVEITGTEENFIRKVQKSKEYYAARKRYENYQNWKTNRNPARAAYEQQSGYDVKHASHCLRLLYQALDILQNGEVFVDVEKFDSKKYHFLRNVKHGEVSYEAVKEECDKLFDEVKNKDFGSLGQIMSEKELSEIFIETLGIHEKTIT